MVEEVALKSPSRSLEEIGCSLGIDANEIVNSGIATNRSVYKSIGYLVAIDDSICFVLTAAYLLD